MVPFVTDFRGRWAGEAVAVALPADTGQAAEVMRLAFEHELPIYPLGGNTGLCYGAVPVAPGRRAGIVLGLGRMTGLRGVDCAANVLTVDAGMTLAAVHAVAAREDRQFPLHLGSEGTAQIGGLISTNAGGTGVLRYGTMRDLVCGIEAVLPDGRILRDLDALKKNNSGYDLKQLFIGAEGTLGLVTGAALRMRQQVRSRAHAWVSVTDPVAAVELLSRLQDRCGETIEAFEMLNRAEVDCVLAHIPRARSPFDVTPEWSVMIELGDTDPATDLMPALEEVLGAAMEAGLAHDAMIAQNEAQAKDIWHVRHSVTEAHKIEGVGIVHDTAVPISKVPNFIAAADAMTAERFPEAGRLIVAHLGDGNVHYIVMFPHDDWRALADKEAKALDVEMAVHDIASRFGGTISAEHGIGRKLTSELERLGDPVKIAVMRDIKRVLDPKNIMNPGALIK
ncbi:FAD-binding oxidoreductase [Mesorhizobium plurifarium]|nr:FAD-binding oxidoreductase [Mesorhizobium plurifarium]